MHRTSVTHAFGCGTRQRRQLSAESANSGVAHSVAYTTPSVPGASCTQVIRNYHGHLSGIYSIALHPTLDVLMTGGRDAVCRVWDMRTKVQVHCLSGHDDTVCSILSQGVDPQARTPCQTILYHHKSGSGPLHCHLRLFLRAKHRASAAACHL